MLHLPTLKRLQQCVDDDHDGYDDLVCGQSEAIWDPQDIRRQRQPVQLGKICTASALHALLLSFLAIVHGHRCFSGNTLLE